MSTTPPIGAQEKDLLLPFESEHIPEFYKDYYQIKRNNFFASIQAFPAMWRYYLMLDRIWLREFGNLKPPGDPKLLFPLMLFINSHAKIRVSLELAFAGCMPEARSILRDGVEFVAHAHKMAIDPKLQKVWLGKNQEKEAFRDAFERHKREGLFKGLEELHKTWSTLSETGSHATLNAICDRFLATEQADGGHVWTLNYCGVEPRVWEMSLFSLLLTCFTMENTFFGLYESRLKLDFVLIEMRSEFEKHKEHVREYVKTRYDLKAPVSGV